MADRTLDVTYLISLIDKGTVPLLAGDKKVRTSVAETSKVIDKQAVAQARAAESAKRASIVQTNAALKVERAQDKASRATERYGAESIQAREAAAKLEGAQLKLETATRRAGDAAEKSASKQAAAARVEQDAAEKTARAQQSAARQAEAAQRREDATARRSRTQARASVRSGASRAASAVGIGGGFAVAAGIREVVGQTVGFDKAIRNVNSIAQLSERRLNSLATSVRGLAGPTAQAPATLAQGMYDLVSSGFKAGEALKIVRQSARAATAGLTDTATSTKAVAAVLNAYHRPASDAKNISDVLFQTVNKGVITFEELAQNIGDVLPFASSLGVGLDQVGASISTMTKAGISAPETMTRIKSVMAALIKPSMAANKAIHDTGFESGEALVKAKGFQGAIEALIGTTDGSKAAVAQLFPNIRALGGALALTGKNTKSANRDLQAFGENAKGATSKALAQQSESINYQWNKLKATAADLSIEVGSKAVPAMNDAIGATIGFVRGIENGTGAGGKFADVVTDIWHGMVGVAHTIEPVVAGIGHFVAENPELLKMAGAFTAIALGMKALRFTGQITGVTELLRLLGRVKTEAPVAAAAAETAVAAGGASAVGGTVGRFGRVRGALAGVRSRLPAAAGIATLGVSAAQIAGSAIGGSTGAAVSSVGSGAALGAAAGSVIPGVGTAVGAVGGAVVGGLIAYVHHHESQIQAQVADTLSMKGKRVELHLGGVSVSKGAANAYKKALDRVRAAEESMGGRSNKTDMQGNAVVPKPPPGASKILTDSYHQLGAIAFDSFRQGVEGGAKYRTAGNLLKGFDTALKDVKPAFRDSAAQSMVAFAQELNAEGRLPMRELKKLMRDLGKTYEIGIPAAGQAGKRADAALAASLRAGKARQRAQDLINDLGKTFDNLPANVKLDANNTQAILAESLQTLRHTIKTTHGQEQADAKAAYAQLLAITKDYTGKARDEAVGNSRILGRQVLRNLRNMKDQAVSIFEQVRQNAAISWDMPAPDNVNHGRGPQGLPTSRPKHGRFGGMFAAGGMVDVAVSSGEQLIYPNGSSAVVPGPRVAADNVYTQVPSGTAVITDHGQGLLASGASLGYTLANQRPHFADGGKVGGFGVGYEAGLAGAGTLRGVDGVLAAALKRAAMPQPDKGHPRNPNAMAIPAGSGSYGRMIARANAIEAQHYNYEWGGGHNASFTPTHGEGHGSGPGIGYDCSGAVSSVLHAGGVLGAPLVSGDLASWGAAGSGRQVSIIADASHTIMSLGGHWFGTSGTNPGGGAGWLSGNTMAGRGSTRHPPGMRHGGIAGFKTGGVASQIGKLGHLGASDNSRAASLVRSIAGGLDGVEAGTYGRLVKLRATVMAAVARLRKGDEDRTQTAQIKRLSAALGLVNTEMGRRTGLIVRQVTAQHDALDRATSALDRKMRRKGIDTGSVAGINMQMDLGARQGAELAEQRAQLVLARRMASRAGAHGKVGEIRKQIRDLDDQRAELGTTQIEQGRARVAAKAQRHVDKAQYGTDLVNANIAFQQASQAVAGTSDTAAGMNARASTIVSQLLPALQAQQNAYANQATKLNKSGDKAGAQQAFLAAAQAATDLGNAFAEAKDLVRQASMQIKQDAVDAAGHNETMAGQGLERIRLQQQIDGTADTTSAHQQIADYIKSTIIPDIDATITKLEDQRQEALNTGDIKGAASIEEQIGQKQLERLQQIVEAVSAVKGNTDGLKRFGGDISFSYSGQLYTNDWDQGL